jgi:alkaline phosphatase D
MMSRRGITRRQLLASGVNACAAGSVLRHTVSAQAGGAPAIVRSEAGRPAIEQGVAVGDVTAGRAVVWSRADRPARMLVEYSTSEKFENVLRRTGPAALESSDFTARLVLTGLPANQQIFYRVSFQDLADLRAFSAPEVGSFRTPPDAQRPRDITLAWSADTAGQGWGINPDFGGLRLYRTMRDAEPDVFVHCGDTIYADGVIQPRVTLDDGSTWTNIVTEAKSKVAQTLDDYRGCYKYNLLDGNMRAFNASVGQITLWDDHEVRDNWYETRDLGGDERYQVKSMALLAARARQAFLEFNPVGRHPEDPERIHRTIGYGPLLEIFALDLRSYRGANSANRQPTLTPESALFGADQLAAFKMRLAASRAVWKVIASDLPLAIVVADGKDRFEAFANGDNGAPLGRELEIADLLRFIRDRRIRNVVWITGDIHYCAAHHYHPSRATFTEFDPFWEFVAGPLHAGTFGPNTLDATFGPEAKFVGVPKGMKGNRPPSDGYQFFGTMKIDARTRAMTVRLHNLAGERLYEIELAPAR